MKKKSEAEILEKKLKFANLYRILMVVFFAVAIISSTMAIVVSLNFENYKKAMVPSRWISIVIKTKAMPDSDPDVPQEKYEKLTPIDYANEDGLIEGTWKGKTLDAFLKSHPAVFSFAPSGFINGIKGSENDQELSDYWWALYSPTDPASMGNPDKMAPVGAPWMYLRDVNVYYFALHKNLV